MNQANIHTRNGERRYSCECGSDIKATSSNFRKHTTTKKHQSYLTRINTPPHPRPNEDGTIEEIKGEECSICYEERADYYICAVCKNGHCTICHTNLDKCPFCRSGFRATRDRQARQRRRSLERIRIPQLPRIIPERTMRHLTTVDIIIEYINLYNSTEEWEEGIIIAKALFTRVKREKRHYPQEFRRLREQLYEILITLINYGFYEGTEFLNLFE